MQDQDRRVEELNDAASSADAGGDEVLLQAVISGDQRAFATLVGRHRDAVWRAARRLMGSAPAADDVYQEVFVTLYRNAASIQSAAALRGWLLAVTRRAAQRQWRRRVGEPAHHALLEESDLLTLGVAAGWGADPEVSMQVAERRAVLRRALARLSPQDREVLVLRDLEDRSGAETAALLDVPLATMKTRLHRARLRLLAVARQEVNHG